MRMKIATAAALIALTTLAACNKPAPPPEETNSAAAVENVDEPDAPPPANVAVPAEANAAAASELRDAPPAPDAQTQDDADAVGMTAHVRRDEPVSNNTNP